MSEKIWQLTRCDLFDRLAPDELDRLESRSRVRTFPRGSPIYLPADEARGVLFLAVGRAKICHTTAEGKQAILAFIEAGELFGERAIFDAGEREEYAEAVDASKVILIPGEEMLRLMEAHPHVSLGVTKLVGLRRKRIEQRLKNLLFRSNRERLVHLLLELVEQYGRTQTGGTLIDLRLSHQDLASIVGSTRETATTVLGELQAEGLLRLARQKIVVVDVARLAAAIGLPPPTRAETAPTGSNSLHRAAGMPPKPPR